MTYRNPRFQWLAWLVIALLSACNSGEESPPADDDSSTAPVPPQGSGNGNSGGGGAEAAPEPFNGSPLAIPGQLKAVDFDHGGADIAYHDTSAGNDGNRYRQDVDVDIAANEDSIGGDHQVNQFATGEWLKYTIDVASDGEYSLQLRLASAFSDSAFHLEIDGEDVTGRVQVANTGGWDRYAWIGRDSVPLAAGQHELTVVAEQEFFNFNLLRIEATPNSGPFHGSPSSVPGRIEAEDYDYGGKGVAWEDSTDGNSGGQYRSDGVDIDLSQDAEGGLYDIVDLAADDWMSYRIDVETAGDYEIAFRALGENGGAALRFEIDGQQHGTALAAPQGEFGWVGSDAVTLSAGSHQLRVIATQPAMRLNSIRVEPFVSAPVAATPYHGNALPVPGIFQAEDFDLGGEGIAYHDSVTGNSGGHYRPDEDVDIVMTSDSEGGSFDVTEFSNGEWLQWTIDVTTAVNYDIELRNNSSTEDAAFRIEVDGQDVSGQVSVPGSGSNSSYQWAGSYDVPLSAGQHVLRIASLQQGFNVNSIRMTEHVPPEQPSTPLGDPANVLFSCSFVTSATDCGFGEQSKQTGRASLIDVARDGTTGVRLRTEPGDDDVFGSGSAERTDLWLPQDMSDGFEGREAWWAHSIMFPDDYVVPPSGWGVVFDFHNSGSGPWQANFHVDAGPNGLNFRGYGGVNSGDGQFVAPITSNIERNTWYDFVYHVRWSSGNDGFFKAWVNGRLIVDHQGPTLYEGQGVYLKLANYHSPFGQASSVIHDRVIRGRTALSVSDLPLEGVLDIVDGVLTDLL